MKMWDQMYGGSNKGADQPQPNRAQRRAQQKKTASQQRRAQKAWDRKVAAATKETPTA